MMDGMDKIGKSVVWRESCTQRVQPECVGRVGFHAVALPDLLPALDDIPPGLPRHDPAQVAHSFPCRSDPSIAISVVLWLGDWDRDQALTVACRSRSRLKGSLNARQALAGHRRLTQGNAPHGSVVSNNMNWSNRVVPVAPALEQLP
jgi:hypothetical protein